MEMVPLGVEKAKVTRVLDTNTVEIELNGDSGSVLIDLAGILEPLNTDDCGSDQAIDYAEWALSWNDDVDVVYLERDEQGDEGDEPGEDYLWFEVNGDPYMLNHILINNGWADYDDSSEGTYHEQFLGAAGFAEQHDLGKWPLCGSESTASSPTATVPAIVDVTGQLAPTQPSGSDRTRTAGRGCSLSDSPGAASRQGVTDNPMDGRLGGSLSGFENLYGAPVSTSPFVEYDIDGCGTVYVDQFRGTTVVSITLLSPYASGDLDPTASDDGDWSIEEAVQIAENFLPEDAVFDRPTDRLSFSEPGKLDDVIIVTGTSQQLRNQVPAGAYSFLEVPGNPGSFNYALIPTGSGGVYMISILLGIEE
jgi:hypothetical protein